LRIQKSDLPEWFGPGRDQADQMSGGPIPNRGDSGHVPRRMRSSSFRALRTASRTFAEARQAERLSQSHGWLHRTSPGLKLLLMLASLVAVSLLRDPVPIAVVWSAALILAASTGLPVVRFLKRNLLAALLFGFLLGLPALFNWFVPGTPLLVVARFPHPPFGLPDTLAITSQGLRSCVLLTVRVGTSVAFTLMLIWTTPVFRLLAALPRQTRFLLSVSYRYLIVLLQEMQNLLQARISRQIGHLPVRTERQLAGSGIGHLYLKSQRIAADLTQAMTSRGFTGE
jgi:cobalt/nickel transport system permease protein